MFFDEIKEHVVGGNQSTKSYHQKVEFISEIVDFEGHTERFLKSGERKLNPPKKTVTALLKAWYTKLIGYQKPFHMCLYPTSHESLLLLFDIHTKSNMYGFYYRPRLEESFFQGRGSEFVATSGCVGGRISQMLLKGQYEQARDYLNRIKGFYRTYYLELQPHDYDPYREVNEPLIKLSRECGVPLVATADVHYATKDYAEAQNIMLATRDHKTKSDTDRFQMEANYWFKTEQEMMDEFKEYHPVLWANYRADLVRAIDNTERLLDEVCFDRPEPQIQLPSHYIDDETYQKVQKWKPTSFLLKEA